MKKYISLSLLLAIALSAVAQRHDRTVTGRVVDIVGDRPLELATVVAKNTGGRQVASAISRSDGRFSLALPRVGSYLLAVTFVGYGADTLSVKVEDRPVDVGTLRLRAGVNVETVEFAVEPLIRRENDRIIYDVRSDPDASRTKMMRFMEKIPELKISQKNGNLVYNGQPVDKIIVDGKAISLINAQRQYPMEFIVADYMSQIELILPGSPEYENEKPVLNIKLDRPLPFGAAAEIRPSISSAVQYGAGVDIAANLPWFEMGAGYDYGRRRSPELRTDIERETLTGDNAGSLYESHSRSRNTSDSHRVNLSLLRKILNDRLQFRIEARTDKSVDRSHSSLQSFSGSGEMPSMRSESNGLSVTPFGFDGTLSMTYYIKSTKERLTQTYMTYSYGNARPRSELSSLRESSGDVERTLSLSRTGTDSHRVSLGLATMKRGQRSFSDVKYSLRVNASYIDRHYRNTSEYYMYDPDTADYLLADGRSEGLEYRQRLANIILHSKFKIVKGVMVIARLTGEYVSNRGVFASTGNTPLDYSEFNVLPCMSLFLSKRKSPSLNLDYYRRAMRPNANMLNPYVDDSNPGILVTGNPLLKGETADVLSLRIAEFSLKRTFLSSYSFSYSAEFGHRLIERVSSLRDDVIVSSYANLGSSICHTVKAGVSVNILPRNWLKMDVDGSYKHTRYRYGSGEINTLDRLSASASASSGLGGLFELGVRYGISPSFSSVQSHSSAMYSNLGVSASRYFKKLRLGGSVGCDNLLHGSKILRDEIASQQFRQVSMRERIGRVFSLSLYWRLGQFRNKPLRSDDTVYDTSRDVSFD